MSPSGSATPASDAPNLFVPPMLVFDPGLHVAKINRAAVDKAGCWAVTGSEDKTVRVWGLADGALARTIRLPAGPGEIGKVFAVAISPDGASIAVGGWTRICDADRQEQIYIFDRATGAMVQRIDGLPTNVNHLTISPDGGRMAALLGRGLRIYAWTTRWTEVARDENYGDRCEGADFAVDGRLATTSFDGGIRLYAADPHGTVKPIRSRGAPSGRQPFGIAFSPDGGRLAVGYADTPRVDLFDGTSLATLAPPDLNGIDNGRLARVAWSRDGKTLFAAGGYEVDNGLPVLIWNNATGARLMVPAARDTVVSLVPLPDGDLLVASQDPWLARLAADGTPRWRHEPPAADLRDQQATLLASANGARIGFGYHKAGLSPACFDLTIRSLTLGAVIDATVAAARQTGLPITGTLNQGALGLGQTVLALDRYENARAFAVHPDGDRLVVGADWTLRAFDAGAERLWTRSVPAAVWAVLITGDGRLVVAAYGDGTIRWHGMADGAELLAFLPLADQTNWAAWTPEGFYAATSGAHGVLRWHINRGWDAAADSIAIMTIPGSHRPTVLPLVLSERETPRALGLAEIAEHGRQVLLRLRSQVAPGARLHVLTIGISVYNPEFAGHLRLHYADQDADALASALVSTQAGLYAVWPQTLLNKDASKSGILRALKVMRASLESNTGDDLAIVHFAGHGAMVDGKLYLLPYEVDARDDVGLQANGLSSDDLRGELLALARHGRVLVLLDACHAGATTMDGGGIAFDSDALRIGLAAANVTVLTSCQGGETAREDDNWRHGAFTKAVLDALDDPAADIDRNGLISTTGLANYVVARVLTLTDGMQTPGLEVRFNTTLFASAS